MLNLYKGTGRWMHAPKIFNIHVRSRPRVCDMLHSTHFHLETALLRPTAFDSDWMQLAGVIQEASISTPELHFLLGYNLQTKGPWPSEAFSALSQLLRCFFISPKLWRGDPLPCHIQWFPEVSLEDASNRIRRSWYGCRENWGGKQLVEDAIEERFG